MIQKKQTWIAVFLCCIALALGAQNPYGTHWKNELLWTGGSTLGMGGSLLLHRHNQPFTPAQVAMLDISSVPRFERFATRQYSHSAKKASDVLLLAATASPIILLLDKDIRTNTPTTNLLVGESMFLNAAITSLCKEIVRRPRPYTYNQEVPLSDKTTKYARQSFFSGHTSMSAAATFSAARIWSDYHPDSEWKPVVWAAAAAIPATVGFLRVKAGRHYLTDVLTGFAVGSACGLLVPHFHRKRN